MLDFFELCDFSPVVFFSTFKLVCFGKQGFSLWSNFDYLWESLALKAHYYIFYCIIMVVLWEQNIYSISISNSILFSCYDFFIKVLIYHQNYIFLNSICQFYFWYILMHGKNKTQKIINYVQKLIMCIIKHGKSQIMRKTVYRIFLEWKMEMIPNFQGLILASIATIWTSITVSTHVHHEYFC